MRPWMTEDNFLKMLSDHDVQMCVHYDAPSATLYVTFNKHDEHDWFRKCYTIRQEDLWSKKSLVPKLTNLLFNFIEECASKKGD